MTRQLLAAALAAALLAGCAGASDRSVRREAALLEREQARAALDSLAGRPQPLHRPVILLAGWNDDPALWDAFRAWLSACAADAPGRVFAPDLRGPGGLRGAADRVVAQFGGLGEVDVVAHSAGGLVAREAAREGRAGGRLRVARLWTLGTPHGGTKWSLFHRLLPLHDQVADCRPDSRFLRRLDADPSSRAMPICACWAEGDLVIARESATAVGAERRVYARAPGGRVHERSIADPRFVRDVIAALIEGRTLSAAPAGTDERRPALSASVRDAAGPGTGESPSR